MNRLLKVITVLFAASLVNLASAVPITGNIALEGGATLDGAIDVATQVNSFVDVTVTSVSTGSVLDSTINANDAVTMSAPWVLTAGLPALWTVGGFTFDLTSSAIVLQSASFLIVEGTGTVWGGIYDPTPGTWRFSTQSPPGAGGVFSFSAGTAIPDGGTTALLLGLGLTGIALVSRSRRRV